MTRLRAAVLAVALALPVAVAPAVVAGPTPDSCCTVRWVYVCTGHPYGPLGTLVSRTVYSAAAAGYLINQGWACRATQQRPV